MSEHSEGIVYIDGTWCPGAEAVLPIVDTAIQPGLAVMDAFPVSAGRMFRLDAHLDRFFASVKVVRFNSFPHTREAFEAIVVETVRRSGLRDALVTIMASRGRRALDRSGRDHDLTPTVMVHCRPAKDLSSHRKNGYRACVSSMRSIPPQCLPPQVKHFNRIPNYLAELEAADAGVDVPIMLDLDGYVTEGPTFNVFAVRNGRLFTPADGMLRGITRDTVIKIAAHHGIPVTEGRVVPYDLYTADEVFVTSVSRGAIAVVEIDRRDVGDGRPGPISDRLGDTYWSWRVDSPYAQAVSEHDQSVAAR
jgi:branched-chain amino acid aminotransferase